MDRWPAATLQAFAEKAFLQAGLPEGDARAVAQLMVEADLQGSEGHGIFRLPQYIRRLRAGGVNPRPRLRIERERAATALVHGDNGMGHLVMKALKRDRGIPNWGKKGVGVTGANGLLDRVDALCFAAPIFFHSIRWYFNL